MKNFFLDISYKGTNYHGSQFQNNAISVMDTFQNAVKSVVKDISFTLKACSRTDSGVHANSFCISMLCDCGINPEGLKRGLNSFLPDDIAVNICKEVPLDFHARYSCKGKRYIYKIWNSETKNPFLSDLSLHYKRHIDAELLNSEAKSFIGTYDFKAFSGKKCTLEDTIRTIYDCKVARDGDMVIVSVSGDGFLYNMVRIIVGTLLAINEGRRPLGSVKAIIESKNRKNAGETASPVGLYLDKVFYDESSFLLK